MLPNISEKGRKGGKQKSARVNIVSYLIQLFQFRDQNARASGEKAVGCPNIVSSGMEVVPLLLTSNMTTVHNLMIAIVMMAFQSTFFIMCFLRQLSKKNILAHWSQRMKSWGR